MTPKTLEQIHVAQTLGQIHVPSDSRKIHVPHTLEQIHPCPLRPQKDSMSTVSGTHQASILTQSGLIGHCKYLRRPRCCRPLGRAWERERRKQSTGTAGRSFREAQTHSPDCYSHDSLVLGDGCP